MKLVVIVVVAVVAVWFVGSMIIGWGNVISRAANDSKENLGSVAGVLEQATKNAQERGYPEDTSWQVKINRLCSEADSAVRDLGTPRSPDEIATYLKTALPIVRANHARLGQFPPPDALADQASKAGRALLKQEALLARVRTAARQGNTTQMLNQLKKLRTLARNTNPNLVKLGLTECTLPSGGIPL